jgi:hypothetical protein
MGVGHETDNKYFRNEYLGNEHPTQVFYEITKERKMNTIKLISTLVAGLTFGVALEANATDWADFHESGTFVGVRLISANSGDTTVLRTVTVVCPMQGHLIAQAETGFFLQQGSYADHAMVAYSLTLDSVAPIEFDRNHYHYLEAYSPVGVMNSTGGIQRIVACKTGQSVTVNFVAWRLEAADDTFAQNPKLSVDFFDKRI